MLQKITYKFIDLNRHTLATFNSIDGMSISVFSILCSWSVAARACWLVHGGCRSLSSGKNQVDTNLHNYHDFVRGIWFALPIYGDSVCSWCVPNRGYLLQPLNDEIVVWRQKKSTRMIVWTFIKWRVTYLLNNLSVSNNYNLKIGKKGRNVKNW